MPITARTKLARVPVSGAALTLWSGVATDEGATLPRKASDVLEEVPRWRHGDRGLRVVPPRTSFAHAKLGSVARQSASDPALTSGRELRETFPDGDEATFLDRTTTFLVVILFVISIGVVPVAFGAVMRAVMGSPAVSDFRPRCGFQGFSSLASRRRRQ
jgi:hypothetical protein